MPIVEQSIEIQSPPAAVFNLIANQPERMADWWTAFELQARVTPAPTVVGSVSRYVYNMLGVKIKGEHQVTALDPNAHLVVKTTSGIDSMFEFVFEPAGRGTQVTVRVEYKLPGSIVGQLANKLVVEKKNEDDLRDALANLKTLLEAEAPS